MDQIAARSVEKQTPLPSLELGVVPVSTGVDSNVGYTRIYGSHIAWKGPKSPLAKEIHPYFVFTRLFQAGRKRPGAEREDRLLLDRVLGDARRLERRLGAGDRRRLDEYLQAVRSVEERLERKGPDGESTWKPRPRARR